MYVSRGHILHRNVGITCNQNSFVIWSFSINQTLVSEIDDFAGDGMGGWNKGLQHTPNYWAVGMRPGETCCAQGPDSMACKTEDQVDFFHSIMSLERRGDFKR